MRKGKRKWWLLVIGAILVIAAFCTLRRGDRPVPPTFLGPYMEKTILVASSQGWDTNRYGSWRRRTTVYSVHEAPDIILTALYRAINEQPVGYLREYGMRVSRDFPEGEVMLEPGRAVLPDQVTPDMRGDGWTTITVEEAPEEGTFDQWVGRAFSKWPEWRFGAYTEIKRSDFVHLHDNTRRFQKKLQELQPGANILWRAVDFYEKHDRERWEGPFGR